MPKLLITGGAGFIGSNAANWFSGNGFEVIVLDNLFLGQKENLEPSVRFIQGSVERPADLERVGRVDYVIHLAASSSAPMFADNLAGTFHNNIIGHINVLEYARKKGIKKVLFASTSSVYGNNDLPFHEGQAITPPNFYAVSKHCQEEVSSIYSQVWGLEIIAFRFLSVYGLHEEHKGKYANLVSQFIWGMEQGKRPTVYGDGTTTRDLTNVKDLIQAFRLAIESKNQFGFTVFNVGTAKATSMLELMNVLNQAMGTDIAPELIENPIKQGYQAHQQADLTKISHELKYIPKVSIEDGVAEIVEYRRKFPVPPASLSY